jgi:hypothetical protein
MDDNNMFPKAETQWLAVGRIPEHDLRCLEVKVADARSLSEIPGFLKHDRLENAFFQYGYHISEHLMPDFIETNALPIPWEELFCFVTDYAWVEGSFRFILDKPCWIFHPDVVDRVLALYFARKEYETVRSGNVISPVTKTKNQPVITEADHTALLNVFEVDEVDSGGIPAEPKADKKANHVDYLYSHSSYFSTLKLLVEEISHLLSDCSLTSVPVEDKDGVRFYNLYVDHNPDARTESWGETLLHRVLEWGCDTTKFMPSPQLQPGLGAVKYAETMQVSDEDTFSVEPYDERNYVNAWNKAHPRAVPLVASPIASDPIVEGDGRQDE